MINKKNIKLQDIIKTDQLYIINQKVEKIRILVNILYLLLLKRYEWRIFITKNAHHKQSKYFNKLKNIDKGIKSVRKKSF